MPGPHPGNLEWQDSALCLKVSDPEIFFSKKPRDLREVVEFCGRCAVSDECGVFGDATELPTHRYGVFGGRSPGERAALAESTRPVRARRAVDPLGRSRPRRAG